MSTTNEEKNLTARCMIGKWGCTVQNTDLIIEITDRTITLSGTVKGEDINATFDNSSWWVDDYLFFTADSRFYIHYANKNYLGFGEMVLPGVLGEIKWGAKFTRLE